MFYDIVSALSLSPSATSHLTYYMRRLRGEHLTRQLSMMMALLLVALQVATIIAPPDAANASSSNDIVRGGINTKAPQKTMLEVYDSSGEIRGIFNRFGISRKDIDATKHATINSKNHKLLSLGRNPHSSLDRKMGINGKSYYLRPLYTWGDNVSYKVLEGKRSKDNAYFAIMFDCGNIVVESGSVTPDNTTVETISSGSVVTVKPVPSTKPTPGPATPSTPAPITHVPPVTPTTPTPVVVTPEPVVPAPTPTTPTPTPTTPSGSPQLELKKTGTILRGDGTKAEANLGTAQGGDSIEYTLTTTNTGTAAQADYVVSESLQDILEYADLLDPRGGVLLDGVLNWPKVTIEAGSSYIATFVVVVKNPVPTKPLAVSDPESYDLKMDNMYGNVVSTSLIAPAAKQIEVAGSELPRTGTGTSVTIVVILLALVSFFYFRNRQLIKEISILRGDHHGHGGM